MSFSLLPRSFATRRLELVRLRSARSYVRQRFSQLGLEALEVRALMAIDSGAAGAAIYSPLDVDQDGFIAPNDALLIINELNRPQAPAAAASALPAAASLPETMTPLLDVDGDGVVAASDAQLVINALDSEAVTTLIRIRLEVTDLNGNPITHVATGESFLLKGYVLDQRPQGNEGVFSAFADVTWASALASATGAINHGAYTTGPAGAASAGLLDEIGGTSGQFSPPLGPAEQLLFSANFTAGPTAGNLQFVANPADLVSPGNPTHNSLLFNDPDHTIGGVPTSLIDYGSVSVAIQTSDPVTVSIAAPAADIIEGNAGTTPAEFVVSLSAPSTHEITVNYTTQDGTATSPGDYATNSGTVTFAPGETQKMITVNVVGDRVKEQDSKTFSVKLSNPGEDPNWSLTQDTATATIVDDEPEISIEDPLDVNETDQPSSVIFVVTLSHPSDQTVTVDYTTVPGTAQAGTDFTPVSGTLTFEPGDTSQSITVSVLVDTVDEPLQQFSVKLSNPVNAAGITKDTGTVKIIDDEEPPSLIINPVAVTESSNGDKDLTFTVSLSKSSEQQLTFNYTTVDGTATSPLDFTATSGVLVFESGQRDKTVTVKVHSDALFEGAESMKLRVTSVTDPQIATAEGIGTINDEDVPVLSVNNPTITEGTGNTSTLTFTVHLQPPSLGTVSVDYTIAGVTASLGTDFQAAANNPLTGTLTFAPNEFDKTVSVTIVGDGFDELTETLTLSLSNPVNASLSTEAAVGTGTITDDDPTPEVTIGTPTAISEGNSGTKKLVFPVTLTSLSGLPVTVHYSTTDGTTLEHIAVAGSDYTSVADDTVTIAPGQQSANIEIEILSDTTFEKTENFSVTISNPTNATIPAAGPATAVGTILDDDVIMSIASPAAIVEGTSTNTTTDDKLLEFVVTLSSDESDEPISVHYSTSAGTASAGNDFTAIADGVLTFAPGEKTKTIQVTIKGDALNEQTETFKVTLSNPSGATLDTEHLEATGTITDNDAQPSVKIGPPTATTTEGNTGTKQMSFPVTLSAPSGQDVIVHYSTANRPAGSNSAEAGSDYTQVTEGTLTIPAGSTTGNILIDILGDTTAELSESFDVNLLPSENASLGTPTTATGTILDDDALISITGPTAAVTEGAGAKLEFVVSLLHASSETITVNYSAGGGTASSGNDYTATSGTLIFAPNETSKTISIPITDDSLDEADETFNVTLSNSTGGSINAEHATASGTILDNDPTPTVKIGTPDPLVEGNSGTKTLVFPVTLSAPSGQTVVVHYKTTDGTAQATSDFTGVTDNTITFEPGQTQKNIVINVLGDTTVETTETFTVTLTSSDHADLGTPVVATGTITDDDNLLTVATPEPITEGTGETKTLTFVVTLAQSSTETVTVDYVVGGGTATSGADYTPASGTLIFTPGQTTKTVVVTIAGDSLNEATETLNLTLSNPTNAGLGGTTLVTTGTINDDDSLPKVSIGTPSKITEGNGTKTYNFPVTLSAPSGQAVTIHYSTTSGTAIAGSDFTGVTDNTITIPAGQTSGNIPITILGDTQVEQDESFTVTISNPQNAALDTTTTATGTIADDDALLTISDASVVEGNNGLVQMVFTVSLSSPQSVDVTVRVNSRDGTALADDDYRLTRNVLVTIPAGQTSATVSIDVGGDSFKEADETFTVELSSPTNASLGAKTIGTGTIINDDQKGVISGFTYVDTNNNGTKDPGEKPLAGVMMQLVRTDNVGVPLSRTTLTAADGSYTFGDLDPGVYRVSETQPAGLADGKDTGYSGVVLTTGDSLSMTILGETRTNNNFGERGVEAPVISKRSFFAVNKTVIPTTPPSFAVSEVTVTINIANAAAATASGTSTPGAHVALVANDGLNTSIGYTTTVGADGKWSITGIDLSQLNDGTINYQLAASDSYGNTALINRTATKAAVAITAATEQINTTNVTNVSVSGTVQPGATVKVVASDDASTPHSVTATATVAANGTWTITGFDLSSLNDGPIQFVATATDASNNSVSAIRKVSKGTQ